MSLGNILLDEDGVVTLSDFFCCVSILEGETFVQVDKVVGTYNYLDDKYMRNGVVSEETDVFAIGMFMILKILTGKESFLDFYLEEKEQGEGEDYGTDYEFESKMRRRLQNWLSKLKGDRRMDEIADPKMIEKMGQISEQELRQMQAFLMLSLRCMGHKGEVPTMVEVAEELKKIQRSLHNDSSSLSGETIFEKCAEN